MAWRCNICLVFVAISLKVLLSHINVHHSQEPGFNVLCGIDGCPRSFTKYNTFWRHVHKDHPDDERVSDSIPREVNNVSSGQSIHMNITENPEDGEDNGEPVHNESASTQTSYTSAEEMKKKMAIYTLTLREHYRVRESATDFIVNQTNMILTQQAHQLQTRVREKLLTIGVSNANLTEVDAIFDQSDKPFDGLGTTYGRKTYLESSLDIIVPEVITVGQETRTRIKNGQRELIVINITFTYIPLMESVRQYLQHDAIADLVFRSEHSNREGYYCDLFNGTVFANHHILNNGSNALGFILYFDDVEICNPLGKVSGTHKVCAFYYSIVNLPLEYRSRLPAIRLLALMKRKHVTQYGINKILNRIKEDLQIFAEGIIIKIKNQNKLIKGAVLAFVGDTLASHEFCGFKLGVGFSYQKCRECYCTNTDMQNKFHERYFNVRSLNHYDTECREIENSHTKSFRKRQSTVYGINFRSAARDFPAFNLITMVPEDIMHVIFEGVVLYEVKNCLTTLVGSGMFSLHRLNLVIENFCYGYKDKECRPSAIPEAVFQKNDTTSLHQSATSMIVLLKLLPFFLIDKLDCDPESNILTFLIELCDIVKLLMTPVIALDTVKYLQSLIETHLKKFKEIFPSKNIIPKQHYLLHLPSTIERYGPLAHIWSMRFEAKHQFLKQRMSGSRNYQNIVKSLTDRCLMYEASLNVGENHCMFANDFVVGKSQNVSNVDSMKNQIQAFFGTAYNNIHSVHEVNWIRYKGQKFIRNECVIAFGENEGIPEFGLLKSVLITEEKVDDSRCQQIYFSLSMYETLHYDEQLLAYEVTQPTLAQGFELVKVENIFLYTPLHVYKSNDAKQYVFLTHDMADITQFMSTRVYAK